MKKKKICLIISIICIVLINTISSYAENSIGIYISDKYLMDVPLQYVLNEEYGFIINMNRYTSNRKWKC